MRKQCCAIKQAHVLKLLPALAEICIVIIAISESAGVVYATDSQPKHPSIQQQAYIKASNTEGGDFFSWSVAVSGDTLVVGADREDSNNAGINGNQNDNSATSSGAAYVYTRNGRTWHQQAYLKASNADAGDRFGASLAISGDTLVVGAARESSNSTGVNGDQNGDSATASGAAYIFTRNGTQWSQQAYLKASNSGEGDLFGASVAISGDVVVIGTALEDSNAAGVNGDENDNSADNAGAAYIFVRDGEQWSQQAYLKASNSGEGDLFGTSVAVFGDTVVVGAIGEDSYSTGVNGDENDNSAEDSGAVYVFTRNGTQWSQQAFLKASNSDNLDQFGSSVAISGDTVIVGAPLEDSNAIGVNGNQNDNSAARAGAAYVFTVKGTDWSQQAYLKASNTEAGDEFAATISITGDTLVVGAYPEDSNARAINGDQHDNSAPSAGAAYVFSRSGTTWSQHSYLKASNTDAVDGFAHSLAISNDNLVVGALLEDSTATGIDGDQHDNLAEDAGAAYVFDTPSEFTINAGLNDAWFNPTTNGQGFLITVFPDIKQMFLAWFTYDTERPPEDVEALLGEPGHRWLTAQGPYSEDTANLVIFVTKGGVFDTAEPVAETDPTGDGAMTIEFADCTAGLVKYQITSLGISGEIPIQRLTSDNVLLCEVLASP